MRKLALVAISARAMAQAATRDGYDVVAIDLFGDVDTRTACRRWLPAGSPGALRLDQALILSHLQDLVRSAEVDGWVAGGGCEGLPSLLAVGATLLPLIGAPPQAVARVREPHSFFSWLDANRIPHPEVRHTPPSDTRGWLLKSARGSGGSHVRAVTTSDVRRSLPSHRYFQKHVSGIPMSASYCANGRQACILGFNEGLVRGDAGRFGYAGIVGPVVVPPALHRQVGAWLNLMAAEFDLRGLGSLDFMLDEECIQVLEVNPRPSASMALYEDAMHVGVMDAHVHACTDRLLPRLAPTRADIQTVGGERVVFASHALRLSASAAELLQALPHCHDLPTAGAEFSSGHPICTVSARAADAHRTRMLLQERHDEVLNLLETH